MQRAQRVQGVVGLERWGEGCAGAGRTRGPGWGAKSDEGVGGL